MDTHALLSVIGETDLTVVPGHKQDPFFSVARPPEVYIPTGIEAVDGDEGPGDGYSIFVSARGATGKSAFAEYASSILQAPLWLTDRDLALGGASLEHKLLRYVREIEVQTKISNLNNPVVIVDALDEAEVRISAQSWQEFKDSLVKFAKLGIKFVICGRDLATQDVKSRFAAESIGYASYELKPFDTIQRTALVDALYESLGGLHSTSAAYIDSRNRILDSLTFKIGGELDEEFAGYAPVLQAVAAKLASQSNISSKGSRQEFTDLNSVIQTMGSIVEQILIREQEKFFLTLGDELRGQAGLEANELYSPLEQIQILLHKFGFLSEAPELSGLTGKAKDIYNEKRDKQAMDHPFLASAAELRWSSSVFEGYCLARHANEIFGRSELFAAAAKNPFFAVFWDYTVDAGTDSYGAAALHSSLLSFAGSVELSDSRISSTVANGKIVDRGNQFVYQGEIVSRFDGESRLSMSREVSIRGTEESFLTYRGPLQSLEIDTPGGYIVLDPDDRAPFLGPGLVVNADVLELASREVKLPSLKGRQLFVASANEFICPLPKINSMRNDACEWITLMPRLRGGQRAEEIYPHQWRECFSPYPRFNVSDQVRDHADASIYKFFRLIEGLRILSTRYSPGGMTASGFSAKAGLTRGRPETTSVLELLEENSLVRIEGEMILAVESAPLPLFATPLTRPKNSAPPFFQLNGDQQRQWIRLLAGFSLATKKGS